MQFPVNKETLELEGQRVTVDLNKALVGFVYDINDIPDVYFVRELVERAKDLREIAKSVNKCEEVARKIALEHESKSWAPHGVDQFVRDHSPKIMMLAVIMSDRDREYEDLIKASETHGGESVYITILTEDTLGIGFMVNEDE